MYVYVYRNAEARERLDPHMHANIKQNWTLFWSWNCWSFFLFCERA